jgi:hypothetical protein
MLASNATRLIDTCVRSARLGFSHPIVRFVEILDASDASVIAVLAWCIVRMLESNPPTTRARYESAKKEARRRELGLWSDPAPGIGDSHGPDAEGVTNA